MTADVDPWFDRAACRGLAPMFDPPPTGTSPAAKERRRRYIEAAVAVCATCTVAAECEADYRRGRDEGIRFGRVLPPLNPPAKKGTRRKPDHEEQVRHLTACGLSVTVIADRLGITERTVVRIRARLAERGVA